MVLAIPDWLRNKKPKYIFNNLIKNMPLQGMTTICEEALCPNRGECISHGIVTVMILGSKCTRACSFCAVERAKPESVDLDEPQKMLDMVNYMNVSYVVITSPTRDDLFDGGANQFRRVVEYLRQEKPELKIEVLIPDFANQTFAFDDIIAAKPDMLCFDVQTVNSLYPAVRPGFSYLNALNLFQYFSKNSSLKLKSGIMLGLGETREEIKILMEDLYRVGVRYLTMGQYLAPPESKLSVKEYVLPSVYEEYTQLAESMGFWIQAGPLVRSSYMADKAFL